MPRLPLAATAADVAAREPLAAAPEVPLAAAGREPLFLYGTLTDAHVLARVLGRPVDPGELAPARLDGFARVWAVGASYPVLVPAAPEASVGGLLLPRASRRDVARLNHYESGEYRAELRPVRPADGGRSLAAWLYVQLAHLLPGAEPWDLEGWRRWHKAALLAACDGWMAGCPEAEEDEAPERPPEGLGRSN